MTVDRDGIERAIRQAWESRDYDAAATVAIREYGPEIMGLMVALMRAESEASEAFSLFCEDLWRGLPDFRWQCTARVWAYTLARHAAGRHAASPHRRPGRNLPLSRARRISRLAQQVRTSTLPLLRTELKNRVRALREQLPLPDQELLILRVDRQLSWRDIARVTSGEGKVAGEQELDEVAGRLRKRFHKIKAKLKRLAEAAGLTGRRR